MAETTTSYEVIFESNTLSDDIKKIAETTAAACFKDERIGNLIGRIQNRLYILGAQPSAGKTTLFLQWADEFAAKGHPVIFANLEMPKAELLKKSLSRLSNGTLPLRDIEQLDEAQLSEAASQYLEPVAKNIMFIDRPITPLELSFYVSNIPNDSNLSPIVFVDYIQIMKPASNKTYIEERNAIRDTVASLREIANGHKCPIFAISSIRRSEYSKGNAGLDALAEAQSLEYGADVVAFLSISKEKEGLYDPSKGKRPVTLSVVKNRYGKTGAIELVFDANFASFEVS